MGVLMRKERGDGQMDEEGTADPLRIQAVADAPPEAAPVPGFLLAGVLPAWVLLAGVDPLAGARLVGVFLGGVFFVPVSLG